MTLASLLFRRQTASPSPQPQSVDQLVKPWPLATASANTAAPEDEDAWPSAEPPSPAVRDRLARFISRS